MRTDLVPPQQSCRGFLRWSLSDGDKPTFTTIYGSRLAFIPVAYVAIIGLFFLVVPLLAMMPGQPKYPQKVWLQMFLIAWPISTLIFYAARMFWIMAEPYRLSLDLATRHYILRKGFRKNERVWTGTFDDIREIYLRKHGRPRGSDEYGYSVIISWKISGQSTPLWTYGSKSADDSAPETWARAFCQELGVPFGGVLAGDFVKRWKRD